MYRSAPTPQSIPWDIVQSCDRAGVRLTWSRRRHGEGAQKHVVTVEPIDADGVAEELGPFDRCQASLVFESMQTALLVAAQEQRARLRGIMQRRTRAAAILASRKRIG